MVSSNILKCKNVFISVHIEQYIEVYKTVQLLQLTTYHLSVKHIRLII